MSLLSTAKTSVVISLFSQMDGLGIGITVFLLAVSVYSWAIILERIIFFKEMERGFWEFERVFRKSQKLEAIASAIEDIPESALSRIFRKGHSVLKESLEVLSAGTSHHGNETELKAGMVEIQIDLLKESLGIAADDEAAVFERRLGVLGTIAAAGPFVGLLGTVWGIMVAFHSMGGAGTAEFRVVAAGISSALLTTVAGLLAAIPALVSHNYFIHKSQRFGARIDEFNDRFQRLAWHRLMQSASEPCEQDLSSEREQPIEREQAGDQEPRSEIE
ncbi:MAG: MotA/TolQ/ExbB proton channel family protein [Candidatus Coatesbacteria bacterium]|nr:MotA/TolQ/ExbB proton channel family protein [Candidatus Coatesbacteria bacterium]